MATQSDGDRAAGQTTARRPWAFIVVGVAILAAAVVIFSSAGPDRSRTTELKDTAPYAVNPKNAPTQKMEQNVDMPTAPKSR
jgi:hypothetical protein